MTETEFDMIQHLTPLWFNLVHGNPTPMRDTPSYYALSFCTVLLKLLQQFK